MSLKETVAHVVAGVVAGILFIPHPFFSHLVSILFMLYQAIDWALTDEGAGIELFEYLFGLLVGFIAYTILVFVGVI